MAADGEALEVGVGGERGDRVYPEDPPPQFSLATLPCDQGE